MGFFSGLFRGRDAPVNRTAGSSYSFFLGNSTSGKRVNERKDGIGIRFGVVITLKEMNGVNRIDDFIKNCTLKGWLVNVVDVRSRIDIHKKLNEDIEFN